MSTIQTQFPLHQGHIPTAQSYSIFQTPGQEIGSIISFGSNLPTNYRRNLFKSVFSGLSLSIPTLFFAFAFLYLVFQFPIMLATILSVALSIGVFWSIWNFGEQPHFCTFVGQKGVARFTCRHGNQNKVIENLAFRFEDADTLTKKVVRMSTNGIYTGTIYDFTWHDQNGKEVCSLHAEAKDHAISFVDSEVPFLLAAEKQWNEYLLAIKKSEMSENAK